MPTVPRYSEFQAIQSVTPVTPIQDNGYAAMREAGIAGQGPQALGKGMEQLGNAVADAGSDMEQQANQVRVNDAVNQLKQTQLALTFDPQQGFKNIKGADALNRPDGVALPDEYGQRLQDTASSIADNLGNEAQRRMFQMHANDALTSFKGEVESHMLGEFRNYALSTQDGTVKTAADTAKLNWNNPNKIGPAIDSAKAAVYEAGRIKGDAAVETQAKMQQVTSAIHMGVIDAALQENNPEYALAYLNSKKDQMTADDLLKTRGIINKDVYARISDGIATNVTASFRPKLQPTDLDRMAEITAQTESGKNMNAVGPNVPGQGTAKSDMQVMDATAKNPGFGIKPADPDNLRDRSRVGRELLGALTTKYAGDPQKTWAAYNAGSGNVDKAIADAAKNGSNWLDELAKYQSPANHQQTVDYVKKNMAALESGGGSPARPTLQDFHDAARAYLAKTYGDSPPPGVLKMTLDATTKQYNDTNQAIKAQGETAVTQAQQWLIANQGDIGKMPSALRSAVVAFAPDKMDNLQDFANKIASPPTKTNMGAYNYAMEHPDQLAAMSPAEFRQFQAENFDQATQKQIEKLRTDEINGKTDQSAGTLNNKAFNATVNNRLQSIGITLPVGPKDTTNAERVGTIKKYLADGIYAQQQQTGSKMTPKEISDFVDSAIAKDVTFRNTFLGVQTGTSSQKLLSMTVKDIPSDTLTAIRQGLAQRGQPNPTNDTILRSYWTWKNAKR